jgi:DNA-binding MarR family transcriptional regulator
MINHFDSAKVTVSKLSKLQKRILEEGLISHWREPVHRAWAASEPGSFDIRQILEDFFGADKQDVKRSYWLTRRGDHRERLAKPRAAISRAISRLTKRGFLERIKPTGRGRWRLSPAGQEGAALVCPSLLKPTRTEMLPKIKQAFLQRKRALGSARLSESVTLKDFVASVLPQRKPRLHEYRKNNVRRGVEVKFIGLD